MIDASVCFKKQVKSNVVSLFWFLLTGFIVFFPIIIAIVYPMLSYPSSRDIECQVKFMNYFMLSFGVGCVINFLWATVIAIPFVSCYIYRRDELEVGRND
jgi:hypothetical protein